ncbi:MAG: ABC transporter ATP-binding protein [Candidatus Bathyarchaeota archaeon]|nr:ABC transporter ATP-binding protein [Candidatus Bathyarchaeota archaeon]
MAHENSLLTIRGLRTYFYTYKGVVKALEGVNLRIGGKEILGLVGETGCGKTVTGLSILRLIDSPGEIIEGEIVFKGEDLLKLSENEMSERIRGEKISMIFQEPRSSLNPTYTVGSQISEAIRLHQRVDKREAMKRAVAMLRQTGMPDPERIATEHPHELSGGMAQRAMIAMALSCDPELLIADEPTSSLDVTIEAQILELIKDLTSEFRASVLLITHDLGIVAETCDKVAVMYAGNVIEYGDIRDIFKRHKHPYTEGLLNAVPKLRISGELYPIKGTVPNLITPPTGCRFHPRCPEARKICSERKPSETEVEPGHWVCCFLYEGGEGQKCEA